MRTRSRGVFYERSDDRPNSITTTGSAHQVVHLPQLAFLPSNPAPVHAKDALSFKAVSESSSKDVWTDQHSRLQPHIISVNSLPSPNTTRPGIYAATRTFVLPAGQQLVITQDIRGSAQGGAVVWDAAWPLVDWLLQSGALQKCSTAVELGCGTGIVAIAVAKSGVPVVVATDGSQEVCDLCRRNGELNGTPLSVLRHQWGSDDIAATIAACREAEMLWAEDASVQPKKDEHRGGRLIMFSDLYYHNESIPGPGNALERSVRALISAGGFRMVVASWKTRTFREEGFLRRLQDLGKVLPTVRFANGVCVGALQLSPCD